MYMRPRVYAAVLRLRVSIVYVCVCTYTVTQTIIKNINYKTEQVYSRSVIFLLFKPSDQERSPEHSHPPKTNET